MVPAKLGVAIKMGAAERGLDIHAPVFVPIAIYEMVVRVDANWICLVVSSLFHNGDKKALAGELCRVFGEDLEEVRIVCDESMDASGEYYSFIKCSNYYAHMDDAVASHAIANVVLSYEEPSYLTDREVDEFMDSVLVAESSRIFVVGDMVKVTEGLTSGLNGIIVEPGYEECTVAFSIYTRKFTEKIPVTSLEYVDNVFLHVKFPVTEDRLTAETLPRSGIYSEAREALIVSRHKVHRKRLHRKHPEKG
jgi:hypothetical protein